MRIRHAKKVIEAGLELQKYLSGENLAKAVWQPGWETGGWTMMRTSASKTTTETKAPTSKTATETKTPASETTKEKKTPATKTTTTKNLLEAARQRYMDETLARRNGSEREKLRSKHVKEFDAARKSLREFLGAGALDKVVNRGKPKEAPQALGVFLLSLYMVYFLYLLLTAES